MFSCGFPVPSAISSRSKELTVAWKSGGKVCAYLQVNVCLFELYHTFIHLGLTLKCAYACTDMCVREKECLDGLHAPLFCSVQPCQRVEPDALSEDDIQPKAL